MYEYNLTVFRIGESIEDKDILAYLAEDCSEIAVSLPKRPNKLEGLFQGMADAEPIMLKLTFNNNLCFRGSHVITNSGSASKKPCTTTWQVIIMTNIISEENSIMNRM